jgi:putrescine transport system ATP-binding protein
MTIAAAAHPPHIRIEGVSKRFGEFTAVRDIDLTIGRGELFALLGGSGCGKTTLLRMLAGFAAPTTGRIMIGERDVTAMPPYDRPVNMMFQSYALFPHMTVVDNIAFGLRREGVEKREVARRVAEVMALVKMEGLEHRKPAHLSGGQRQRVALARAVVKKPEVLLLDEPMSALDKKLRAHTQFELSAIQRQLGITFVMVTHDQEEAMAMATRIAVMEAGRIMQVGPPQEIYEQPRNRFVADFIGTVNLLDGTVASAVGDHVVLACPSLGQDILLRTARYLAVGEAASLALRPERITIASEAPRGDGLNSVAGRVHDLAYLGGGSVYRVALAGGQVMEVSRPNLGLGGSAPLAIGERVVLSWSPDAAIPIDP